MTHRHFANQTTEQQIAHLVVTHGLDAAWLRDVDSPADLSDDDVAEMFRAGQLSRHDHHVADHDDGDGPMPTLHTHASPSTNTDTDTADRDVVDALATYLGTNETWSGADMLEVIAQLIGTVRPHPGDAADTYVQQFATDTGRAAPADWIAAT